MVKLLSELNKNLTYVPVPQTTEVAGTMARAATNDIQTWLDNNWLECDGSAISRTTYADLFANIGTKYGIGDGATTFNLPDGPRSTPWFEISLGGTTGQTFAQGRVLQDYTGEYYFHFNINATTASGTNRIPTITGITWAATSIGHAVYTGGSAGSAQTSGANGVQIVTAVADTDWRSSGFIKLASRPTDDIVQNDGRFADLDEAFQDIPVIRVHNNTVPGTAISIAPATDSQLGTISLSPAFAATPSDYGLVQLSQTFEATETQYGLVQKNQILAKSTLTTYSSAVSNILRVENVPDGIYKFTFGMRNIYMEDGKAPGLLSAFVNGSSSIVDLSGVNKDLQIGGLDNGGLVFSAYLYGLTNSSVFELSNGANIIYLETNITNGDTDISRPYYILEKLENQVNVGSAWD